MIKPPHKTLISVIAISILSLVNDPSTFPAALAATSSGSTIKIADPTNAPGNAMGILNSIFGHIYTLFVYIGGAAAVIYIMWAGITYLTAAGDPKKADEGKKSLINAFTGVVILTSTYVIIRLAISVGNLITSGL